MKNINELKKDLVLICKMLYNRNLVSATDGNISVKIGEDKILITPSGVNKGLLSEDMILTVDFNGKVLEGTLRCSKEVGLHVKIYKDRPDVGSVIHTHPPYTTAFAVAHEPIKSNLLIETLVLLGDIALASYSTPGTREVPDSIQGLTAKHDAILLKNHGVITYGTDIITAFNRMDALENVAKTIIMSKILGTPQEIPQEKIDYLKEIQVGKKL
jgi:L-fuculose-phosphate aldolase